MRLGVFEADLRAGELRDSGRSSLLTEQPLRILRLLVERDGELVTREEIRRVLWPNDTVVEFDHSINAAIRKLRHAFDDSAGKPRYIETIARRGYRLLVTVERVEAPADKPTAGSTNQQDTRPVPHSGLSRGNLIGRKVSHYRVLEVLGGGGMGMLYKAEDLELERQVALKFLPEELAWDTVALQRFQREARTASSLDHPSICPVFGVEEHGEQPFIVMQLLHGETLRDRLAAINEGRNSLPFGELLHIAIRICDGLRAAHEKGIIHRDIKPANIFLTNSGEVKILDFGLAKLVNAAREMGSDYWQLQAAADGTAGPPGIPRRVPADSTLTRPGASPGTAGYMSPEQVRGEKLDARSDLFSFGLVLYEMASGKRAFSANSASGVQAAILDLTPPPLRDCNRAVPDAFREILTRTLQKDREQRYQTAAELGSDLARLKDASDSHRAIAPARSRRRWRRWLRKSLLSALHFSGPRATLSQHRRDFTASSSGTILRKPG
ncbi:MAG TPA: protein kinase [Candidatus Binatia bacterium]|nr:protein kinase [Candidatus Binatia bacterium]